MSASTRPEDDEEAAEAELRAAAEAAASAPADETVGGLGPSPAPFHLRIRPARKPAQYTFASAKEGEKPLVLAYFTIPGLGEAIRLLLAEVGAEYDHVAMVGGEDPSVALRWRDRSPNGLLPMVTGWGVPRSKPVSQSGAVLRFLARRCGLLGSSEVEAAAADVLYETAKDMGDKTDLICAVDPEKDLTVAKLPFALALRVEKMLQDMADPSDVDAPLNYGQIQLYCLLRRCETRREGCVRANLGAALDDFRKAMESRPGISAYLSSPAAFPFTKGELGQEGGYVYVDGPITRGDRRGDVN